jgi:hypothetical protein
MKRPNHQDNYCVICLLMLAVLLSAGSAPAGGALDSWQWRSPLPQGNPLLGITAGGGKLVAVGDQRTILVSSNAVNWQPVSAGTTGRFCGVAYHDGLFVAAGPGIWTSTNGVEWIQRHDGYLYAVAWENGVYVATGWLGTILTSTDGITWSNCVSGTSENLNAITYGNGTFVAAGGYFTNSALLTSTDAINWTNRTNGSDILAGVTCGNGQFVAVGFNFYGNTAVSLTSPDGVIWTRHILGPAIYSAYGICFDQGLYALASANGLFTSTDGVNWTNRYAEFPNSFFAITPHEGGFVAVGNAGAIVSSPDGTNWIRQSGGTWQAMYGIAQGNNTLVAVGNRGATMRSVDGLNWTYHDLGSNDLLTAITFGQGRFVAVGSVYYAPTNAQTIYTSGDGINWNLQTVPILSYLNDVTFADGTFVAVAGDGYGGQGRILTSTDAQTWKPSTVETNYAIYGVGFGNGLFVAVGAAGTILTSSDGGATWIGQDSGTTQSLSTVGFGDGTFVTGDSYGDILTSTNGIQWCIHSINNFSSVYGIAYGNGTFLAVGGDTVLTSTNAIQWTPRSFPSSDRLNAAIFTGGTFVTVGEWGMMLQSGYFGPPRVGGASLSAEGFRFSVAGEAGQPYRIQTSTNLGHDGVWADWLEHTNGLDEAWFVDTATGAQQRFYRVLVP